MPADIHRILVVDDEVDLVESIAYSLKKGGYAVDVSHNGKEALSVAFSTKPDLILLDVMLPEVPGTEVAARLRTNPITASVPIIMLTAKGEEVDQLVGLAVGADDYIAKPFSMRVLMARIAALLRRADRSPPAQGNQLHANGIVINLDTHEVRVDGELAHLTLTEFRILAALLQTRDKVLSRTALMTRAMGPGVTVTDRTIDVHITAIRRKLGPHAGIIETVRGVGYRVLPTAPKNPASHDASS